MLYSDFRKKEVVNRKTCEKIGRVVDLEFDECTGQICKMVIGKCSCFFPFSFGEPEYVITYRHICQIGPDLILVDIN